MGGGGVDDRLGVLYFVECLAKPESVGIVVENDVEVGSRPGSQPTAISEFVASFWKVCRLITIPPLGGYENVRVFRSYRACADWCASSWAMSGWAVLTGLIREFPKCDAPSGYRELLFHEALDRIQVENEPAAGFHVRADEFGIRATRSRGVRNCCSRTHRLYLSVPALGVFNGLPE